MIGMLQAQYPAPSSGQVMFHAYTAGAHMAMPGSVLPYGQAGQGDGRLH